MLPCSSSAFSLSLVYTNLSFAEAAFPTWSLQLSSISIVSLSALTLVGLRDDLHLLDALNADLVGSGTTYSGAAYCILSSEEVADINTW